MPTATAFRYHKQFAPDGHCVEDKTTAELDALLCARYEDASLANIMALWWNLYTFDVTITGGVFAGTRTMRPGSIGVAGGIADQMVEPEATPRDRVCVTYLSTSLAPHGPTWCTDVNDDFGADPTNGQRFMIWFRGVRHNTTTSKYAILLGWKFGEGGGAGDINTGLERAAAFGPYVTNGGTFTFLGQSTDPGIKGSADIDRSFAISNPVYYTY